MKLELINAARSCLLVIDPQERLMKAVQEPERVVNNTVLLLHCASVLDLPVIASTQYKKGLGAIVEDISILLKDALAFDKMEFNCFFNQEFVRIVQNLPAAVDTLVLTGVEAHICVFQTAVAALQHGYKVWVASDAVSSRSAQNMERALGLLMANGVACASTETILYQMLRRAGSSEFKQMLKYLK